MERDNVQGGIEGGVPSEGLARQSPADSSGYDFERLERAVAFLIEEHERLSSEKAELLEELVDRERRITSLEAGIEHERALRRSAAEGVDKILARLEQLQASATAAAETA